MKKIKQSFLALFTFVTSTISVNASTIQNDYKKIIEKDNQSNYIFLFVYRSATFIDWSNPSDLAKTTLKSQIARKFKGDASSIGHAQIAWYCNDQKGNIKSGATGQTGQEGNEGLQLIKGGWGLSILDTVFTDGHLESQQEVDEKIKKADSNNNMSWLAIKTDYHNCSEMSKFVDDYDKSGAAINYGFPVEPLKFEGAGCTSFANAAISKANLGINLSKAWVRHIKLPKKYMGKRLEPLIKTRPMVLAKNKQDEKIIPMSDFLFKNISWANDNEEYQDFYYYDPELFYESLVHLENRYRENIGLRLKSPIRSKEYDQTQISTKKISEDLMDNLLKNNRLVKIGKIYSTTGLIIEP